jgi:hypothetical protein
LNAVLAAARPLPVEERDGFLRALAAELGQHRDLCRAIRETQQHFREPVGDPQQLRSCRRK